MSLEPLAPETMERIKRHLDSIGVPWDPCYVIGGDVAARAIEQAVKYEDAALAAGVNPCDCPTVQEYRPNVRFIMSRWFIIPEDRIHFVPLDKKGRDMDLRQFMDS